MGKRPRYDDKFRAGAIALLEAAGWPNTEGAMTRTANHLKIPVRTLSRWANQENNPAPDELVIEKKADLADLLTAEIEAALNAMGTARADASYRDLGTVIGILTDKLQLITGGPTENSNTRITIEYADTQIDAAAPAQGPADGHRPGEAL